MVLANRLLLLSVDLVFGIIRGGSTMEQSVCGKLGSTK